ncbi:uncharacterized protein LOC134321621 [Trichomycterus rosablanca]|uniref:uncharacterized protein LOC134321621 n=1 Tax=Trichomycterus rosablanca TaxID=2290929 RepID=UPI002F35FC59
MSQVLLRQDKGESSNIILKFADDTTVLGLITKGDESAYREEVRELAEWCSHSNLHLNISKTKEMIVDYRKRQEDEHAPLYIRGAAVERVRLRKFGLPPKILKNFYKCTIESLLTGCISVWYGNCSLHDRKALQRVVRAAEIIIGHKLPALQDIYRTSCLKKALKITSDHTHPAHGLFTKLPSGRREAQQQQKDELDVLARRLLKLEVAEKDKLATQDKRDKKQLVALESQNSLHQYAPQTQLQAIVPVQPLPPPAAAYPTAYLTVWKPQYPLKPEQSLGIKDTIAGLLTAGVLRKSNSDWNTPILPVSKGEGKGWRMVHDLREINKATVTENIPVPDPYLALQNLTPDHCYFTVIDLANAFFCLPLASYCQQIFSFTYEGQKYTYNRLPQGYKDSPGLFNRALKADLSSLTLPDNTVLVQYVDDLLIAAPDADTCLAATVSLLTLLANLGYKVKQDKLQVARPVVTFLGRQISAIGHTLTATQRQSILQHGKPSTVQDLLAFLGLTGYSRNFIFDYVGLTQPLRDCLAMVGHRNLKAKLIWTIDAEKAFIDLKQALAHAEHLQAPDYEKPFFLDVSERNGIVNAVLFQKGGRESNRQILMYYSSKLDVMEQGQTHCTRQIAALAKAVNKTAHLVMCHPLVINTNHGVVAFLTSTAFTLSPTRKMRISDTLTQPHITFTHKDTVNMAKQLPHTDLEPHDCEFVAQRDLRLREDLGSDPLENPEVVFFCDGCCYRGEEGNVASFAVIEQQGKGFVTRVAEIIPQPASAQLAEIVALTKALELGKDKVLNVYTDSAYAHCAVHVDGPQWMRRGFVTSQNTPVKHAEALKALLSATLLPKLVAVIKCKGHSKTSDLEGLGNNAADAAAKKAGGYTVQMTVKADTWDLIMW